MSIVLFNYHEEFLAELRAEYAEEGLLQDVVRLTRSFQATKMYPAVRNVFILAHFEDCQGHVIRLRQYVGDVVTVPGGVPPHPQNDETDARANEIMQSIESVCQELKLQVRAGAIYLPSELRQS